MAILQQTGRPVKDPGTGHTFRRLDLVAALQHVYVSGREFRETGGMRFTELGVLPEFGSDSVVPSSQFCLACAKSFLVIQHVEEDIDS